MLRQVWDGAQKRSRGETVKIPTRKIKSKVSERIGRAIPY